MTNLFTRTAGDIVSEILMSRSVFDGSLLVVEGDSDVRFWQTRITSRCQVVLAGGKKSLIDAVVRAYEIRQVGILGVVDDDCDSLLGRQLPSPHLVATDVRDAEALMLRSAAFDRVVAELGDPRKMRAFEEAEGRTVRDSLVARSLIFGQLRYLNALNGWNVNCQTIRPWRFADVPTWRFRRQDLLDEFAVCVPGLTSADLERQLSGLGEIDPWRLLHGKDTLDVLAVGLRSVIGNAQHPSERIAQMLRLTFDSNLFAATQLHLGVRTWEAGNPPYQILLS